MDGCFCIMSMPHCVSSAARDTEHGREGGHFALQKRPHNLVAPNAVAYIATSQKGMVCTPRDPKCGRFFFIFLDFGQIPPPPNHFWRAVASQGGGGGGGRGGGVQPTQPQLGTPPQTHFAFLGRFCCHVMLCLVWGFLQKKCCVFHRYIEPTLGHKYVSLCNTTECRK